MKTEHILLCAAALVLGVKIGQDRAARAAATPTARNDINQVSDWWTYAGSWS